MVANSTESKGRQIINENSKTLRPREPVSSSAQHKADIYWAEVVAGATATVAAEMAERATSAAEAYERKREPGHGDRFEGEAGPSGGQQLPRQGEHDFDPWLESRLAVAAAATASRTAATAARRVATLTAASTSAPAPAEEGGAEAGQGAESSCLRHEEGGGGGGGGGEGGEGGGEYPPDRPEGGSGGGRRKHSFTNYDVDVGAWNWADVGGGGIADDGRAFRVLAGGVGVGEEGDFAGRWGVVSERACSAGGAPGFGTGSTLR